jgi:hypothetical protein
MISELDETIRQMLVAEIPLKNGEVEISFHQPKREWSSRLTKPTLNFYLYNLRENTTLRNMQWEKLPRPDNQSHQKRTPFRVDCYYMITSWAQEPDDEHRLMSRCLMALFRFPLLPEKYLVGSLRNQPFDLMAQLADPEVLTNPSDVWNVMDNEMKPSIPYIVTLALDPWREVTGPVVRTFTLRPGQAKRLPRKQMLDVKDMNVEMIFIGGYIRDKASNEPLGGIEISIKGTGIHTQSDAEGKFILGSIPPGEYTLVAKLADKKPYERKVAVPARDGNYDLTL